MFCGAQYLYMQVKIVQVNALCLFVIFITAIALKFLTGWGSDSNDSNEKQKLSQTHPFSAEISISHYL